MLTILNDPAGITGVRRIPLDPSVSLQANIERHLSGGAGAELRINGMIVDPLEDRRLDAPPAPGDLVTITLRPAGFDPITAAWGLSEWVTAVSVAVNLSTALRRPSGGAFDSSAGKDSPNNRLTAQSNSARAYQAVPDVFGYRRLWPDLIQPSTVEYVDHIKYVTEWLCVSRGIGTITSVQFAETPLTDIDGSSFEVFEPAGGDAYPERNTTTLHDVVETFASDEVNGQEVPYTTPFPAVTKTGTFSLTNASTTLTISIPDGPDLDQLKSVIPAGTAHVVFDGGGGPGSYDVTATVSAVSVGSGTATFTFTVPDPGLTASGTTSITITPTGTAFEVVGPFTLPIDGSAIWWNTVFLRGLRGSVVIRADWWKVDGGGAEVGGTRQQQDFTYTANTYDQRFFTTKVTPTAGAGRYRVQFTRLTAQIDSNGADVAKVEELYAVRTFGTKDLPGVTVMRVTTKATLSATGFSDRKFNLRWMRHVRALTSDTLSPSRNFARAMAHLWTVARRSLVDLDTDALAAINQEHGDDSPLLRFDGSLDDADMSLGERMAFIADTARCDVWRDGTRWTVTRDQRRTAPELQFDYRNLAAGGDSAIHYAAHLPASNDGVEVEYVDEATQVKKAYVRLRIGSGAPVNGVAENPKKVKMPGCTTQSQALNRAHLEARKLLHQRVTVSDTALRDAAGLGFGALVRWVDPGDFGGDDLQAGEVLAISGNVITPSEPVEWRGYSEGRILLTGEEGRYVAVPLRCYPSPGGGIELESMPAGVYVADAQRQCGSRFAFAVGLTSDELDSAGLFLTQEVRPSAEGTVSIACVSYDDRIYEGDDA